MNKNYTKHLPLVTLGILAILFAFWFMDSKHTDTSVNAGSDITFSNQNNTTEDNTVEISENTVIAAVQVVPINKEPVLTENTKKSPGIRVSGYTPGTFFPYDAAAVTGQKNKKIVLLFLDENDADSQELRADIKDNLIDIPNGTALYEVTFDNNFVKLNYAVDQPNTYIQIGDEQEEFGRFSGETTLQGLLSNIE